MLVIELLGTVRVTRDGRDVGPFRSRKSALLLGYLAVNRGRQPRDTVAALLWPDRPESEARAELARVVYSLRETLGPVVTGDRRTVGLDPDESFRCDLDLVERAEVEPGAETLAAAAAAYRGPFLADLTMSEAEPEHWLERQRDRHAGRFAAILARLVETAADDDAALRWANVWAEHAPYDEAAHRAVMSLLAGGGRAAAALAHFERLATSLRSTLQVEPDPATTALADQLRANDAAGGLPALPAPVTPLVGRGPLVGTVVKLLTGGEVRLVTLTGPGGVGKTRLSLDIAAAVLADGAVDSACFVELAAVRDPAVVPRMISDALGAVLTTDATDAVVHRLSGRQVLLVLDNVEQLGGAAGTVTALLERLPGLRLLLTSRGPAHVRGEHLVPVPPLDAAATVELFVQRGLAARADFDPDTERADLVAVCGELDGLPLAVELAAAQLRLLSIGAVRARLGGRLELLHGGESDRPDRHRTLRETVLWSYDLLDAPRQRLFRELGVFRGGATERTLAAFAEYTPPSLADLGLLTDAGLLVVDATGPETRFAMLPTIADVAVELLAGDLDAVRDRHEAVFLPLAQSSERRGTDDDGLDQIDRINRIDVELENVRAGLDHAQARGPVALATWCLALYSYWFSRSDRSEAIARLGTCLRARADLGDELTGRLLADRGNFVLGSGDIDGAARLFDEAVTFAPAFPDSWIGARAYAGQTSVAVTIGDLATIETLAPKALEAARAAGDVHSVLQTLIMLDGLAQARGQFAEATDLTRQGLELCEAEHALLWLPFFLCAAGQCAHDDGDLRRSVGYFAGALAANVRSRILSLRKYILLYTAQAATELGRHRDAARLLGATDAVLAIPGEQWVPYQAAIWDDLARVLTDALPPGEFGICRADGGRLTEPEIVALTAGLVT